MSWPRSTDRPARRLNCRFHAIYDSARRALVAQWNLPSVITWNNPWVLKDAVGRWRPHLAKAGIGALILVVPFSLLVAGPSVAAVGIAGGLYAVATAIPLIGALYSWGKPARAAAEHQQSAQAN